MVPHASPKLIPGYDLVDPNRPSTRRLIISLSGLEKTGKTRISLTAPGPIAYMDYDQRSEGTMEEFTRSGKQVLWRTHPDGRPRPYSIPAEAGASDEKMAEVQSIAKGEWRRFEDDFEALVNNAFVRTIVVDTATEAWELLRLASFGRLAKIPPHLYGEANGAYRRLIRLVRQQTRVNLILVHRLGNEYENVKDKGGEIKGFATGRKERKGFSETGFLADVDLTLTRNPAHECTADDLGFRLTVGECRNTTLRGLELSNSMIDFAFLAQLIDPSSTADDWT